MFKSRQLLKDKLYRYFLTNHPHLPESVINHKYFSNINLCYNLKKDANQQLYNEKER